MSKYGEPKSKDKYITAAISMPEKMVWALDYISRRECIHNRSRIVQAILENDLDVKIAMEKWEELNDEKEQN